MLIPGSKIESDHLLTLVLVGLVEGIRNLEPVARQKEVGVERVLRAQVEIETIEDVPTVADRMDWPEFRCVQEASRSHPICRQEIAGFLATRTKVDGLGDRSEGTVFRLEASRGLCQAQTRTCGRVYNKTGLVAVLGSGRAGDQLHRLDRIHRYLRRECFALLVADRLSVDREGRLRVVSQRMKESIGIGDNPGRRKNDGVAQA